MKPKITIDKKDFIEIRFPRQYMPGGYVLQATITGPRDQKEVKVYVPESNTITRKDARLLYRAAEMLLNRAGGYAGQKWRVGGGKTKKEFNNGEWRVGGWYEWPHYRVTRRRNYIRFAGGAFEPADFAYLIKMVGVAQKINWTFSRRSRRPNPGSRR